MTDEVARFIERFAGVLVEGGVPRMPARVFGALLCSDSGRMTAAELAEALQVSPRPSPAPSATSCRPG